MHIKNSMQYYEPDPLGEILKGFFHVLQTADNILPVWKDAAECFSDNRKESFEVYIPNDSFNLMCPWDFTFLLLYKVIVFLYLFYRFDYAILRYCGLVITSYHLMV